ncbi:MAG: restriction endonuclease subunit S [Verrucomicrobiota bacterium]
MNWPVVKITDCARIVSGATPKTSEPKYWDGEISWVTPKDISDLDGYPFLDSTPRTLTGEGLSSCSAEMLPPRSVLLSSRAPIGLVAINRIPVATNQGFKSFVPDATRLDSGYLYHWLRANRSFLDNLGTGATFKEISKAVMTRVEIPLPPLDEQKRIAAVLDKADALHRQRKDSLKFTERLLHSVFIDMFGDPKANSNNWEVVPLGNLVADGDTINYGVIQPGSDFTNGVPLIRLGNLAAPDPLMADVKRIDPEIDSSYERSRLIGGEVLIGCVGHTIGVSCIAPMEWAGANVARAVARVNLKQGIAPEFILQQIRTPAIQHYFRGERRIVGQPTLNIKQIKEAPILLPPPELRDRFALFYRATLDGHANKKISETLIDRLFLVIQQRAFRGELDLTRVELDEDLKIAVASPQPESPATQGRYNRPGSFIAPPDIEARMLAFEEQLDSGLGDSIPWDENYFKYRILSQVLQPPFCFTRIWEAVEYDIEDASYEIVKEKVFEYISAGILEQQFDEERKEIVFHPRS